MKDPKDSQKKPFPPSSAKASPPKKASDDQTSEDTERDLMGKPQKFGAAMGDDSDAPPADDAAAPEGAPGVPGPSAPSDPMQDDIPGEGANDEKAAGDQGDALAALQADNADLRERLSAVEAKLGIAGQPEGGGEQMVGPAQPNWDPTSGEDIY